jgi:transcriptional regulator with XRE-family HTH domain
MAGPSDREIGARIAALREQRGWSQRALAKVLGMNQSVLSRIEAGKRRVSATELDELAAALDVDLDLLLTGGERATATPRPRARRRAGPPSADETRTRRAPPDALASGAPRRSPPGSAPPPPAHSRHFRAVLDEASGRALEPSAGHESHFAALPQSPLETSPLPPRPPAVSLPAPADTVIDDYLCLRELAEEDERPWASSLPSSDAMGRRRLADPAPWSPAAHVGVTQARDRYARFMRHELGIGVDGPVPDLVTLFEDARVAEVIVARLRGDTPVAVGMVAYDVAFVFVNAARPAVLQRFALVHSVAHHVLGHGEVVDERIAWSRAEPLESEANDFAEEFLAPADAVARWYERHGDPRPTVDVLLELAAAFGITPWSALYRSRAAARLNPKLQTILGRELREREWSLLPEQALRGGLRDTLSSLSAEAPPPPPGARGVGGMPAPAHLTREPGPEAVLRVPARMRGWALDAVREGRLSLEEAARMLHVLPADLLTVLRLAGLE